MSDHERVASPSTTPNNPYSPNSPARPGRPFFGREALLEYVPERLRPADCRLILLRGPRKIGKTSVLLHLEDRLRQGPFRPVYFDLGPRSDQPLPHLVTDLANAIADASGQTPRPRPSFANLEEAHEHLIATMQQCATTRRFVCLVDEFSAHDPDALPHDATANSVLSYFLRLSTTPDGPAFVIAQGSTPLPPLRSPVAEWLESASVRDVELLDPDAARRLLLEPCANRCSFTDLAIRRLLQLAGGHPYFLQALAFALYETPRNSPAESVGLLEVMATVPRVLAMCDQGLNYLWDGLDQLEQSLVQAAIGQGAAGAPLNPASLWKPLHEKYPNLTLDQVRVSLERLCSQAILHSPGPDAYLFQADLFRRWVTQRFCSHQAQAQAIAPETRALAGGTEDPASDPDDDSELPEDTVEALWRAMEHEETPNRPGSNEAAPSPVPDAPPPSPEKSPREPGRPRKQATTARRPSREDSRETRASSPDHEKGTEFERLLQVGLNSFLQGRYEVAAASYRSALALQPGHVEATAALARVLAESRQFEQALTVLDSLPDTARDVAANTMAEIYLRWLDEVEPDEATWNRVMEDALRALPDHPGLQERKRGGRVLRIRRLLKNGRPLEAAAALGALSPEQQAALSDVQASLLNALEEMTRRGHSDATALFSLLRRQLPSPTQAWLRHLGPLLDEAERAERFNPSQAESLFREAANTVQAAGIESNSVPEALLERLRAGIARSEARRIAMIERRLDELVREGDLDGAESLLEDELVFSPSEVLEARLAELRTQRTLSERYQEAIACVADGAYPEARRLLSSIVSEAPTFTGSDGRTALSVLENLARLERRKAGWRFDRPWAIVWGLVGLAGVTLLLWHWPFGGTHPPREQSDRARVAALGPGHDLLPTPAGPDTPAPMTATRPSETPPAPSSGQAMQPSPPASPRPAPPETGPASRYPYPAPGPESSPAPRKNTGPRHSDRAVPPAPDHTTAATSTTTAQEKRLQTPQPVPRAVTGTTRPAGATDQHPVHASPSSIPKPAAHTPSPRTSSRTLATLPSSILPIHAPSLPTRATPQPDDGRDPYESALQGDANQEEEPAAPTRFSRHDPATARVYVGQGKHYEQQGRLADAIRAYESAVAADPRSAEAHLALGRLYAAQGNRRKAEAALQTVLQLDLYGASGREARRLLRALQQEDTKATDQP